MWAVFGVKRYEGSGVGLSAPVVDSEKKIQKRVLCGRAPD